MTRHTFKIERLALPRLFVAQIFVSTKDNHAIIFGSQPHRNCTRETISAAIDFNGAISHAAKINILTSKY